PEASRAVAIRVGPGHKLSEDFFSLWIDDGAHPTAASYEYIVIPDADRNILTGTSNKDQVEIKSNTPSLQAVRHNGLRVLEAAFFSAGTLNGGKGWTVNADRPCLLLLKETPEGLDVAVSNPENEALGVNVTIDRRLSGDECADTPDGVRVAFSLPGGESAGQSVVRMLRAK
ncbi:MAG: polysaccharide lyase beta-sandwich domain-containing protein, partial [Chloroflexi bacterium]|nr:polysaccharide lyase beta-sandwich domain-containing protein [Chloroflexota bacterium]